MNGLKQRLDMELWNLYYRIKKETGYNSTSSLQMLKNYGGYGTAKRLLGDPKKDPLWLREAPVSWTLGSDSGTPTPSGALVQAFC